MQSPQRKAASSPDAFVGQGSISRPLTTEQFERLSRLLYRICGIDLQPGKEQLVQARLWRRLHTLGLRGFEEYIRLVEGRDGRDEVSFMVDALATNKTSFFRESQHFDFLRREVPSLLGKQDALRIWSAGCSSGQEPYTIGMTLHEAVPDLARRDVRILATDISTKILKTAREGIYDETDLEGIPGSIIRKYFVARQEGADPPCDCPFGARADPLRAPESDGAVADARALRLHLLQKRHDLFRP